MIQDARSGQSLHRYVLVFMIICSIQMSEGLHAQVPDYVPLTGLVGWWPFSGNADDQSGNGNNGTVLGATLATDRQGKQSSAYYFTGANSSIVIQGSSSIESIEKKGNISISAWTRNQSMARNAVFSLLNKYNLMNDGGWEVILAENYADWSVEKYQATIGMGSANPCSPTIRYDEWEHIAITHDSASGIVTLYVNGNKICQRVAPAPISSTNNGPLYFGYSPGGGDEYSKGLIDDLGLWNRTLSAVEIKSLYYAAVVNIPSYVPTDGLVGWWPFNGNANDESGNGHHALVNGPRLVDDRQGKPNSSYYFNGAGDHLFVVDSFFENGWNEWTISLWYNLDSDVFSTQQFSLFLNTEPHRAVAIGLGNGKKYRMGIGNAGANWNSFDPDSMPTRSNFVFGQWKHFAVVKSGMELRTYVDGVLDSTLQLSLPPAPAKCQMYYGQASIPSRQYLKGGLDDVAIWNKALTSSEIGQLFIGEKCPITLTFHPQNAIVAETESAQLEIIATSDSIMRYQWQFNNGAGFKDINDGIQYEGVKTAKLTIRSMSEELQGDYRCLVSTLSCAVMSETAIISLSKSILPGYVPAKGLLGWWPFNGNADDESGNGNNMVVYGPTLSNAGLGSVGQAYEFDGIDDWMTTSKALVKGRVPVSFSFWVKSIDQSSEGNSVIGQYCDTVCWGDVRIVLNEPYFKTRGLSYSSPSHMATAPFETGDDKWHHYTLVMGADSNYQFSNIRFYVDGRRKVIDASSPNHNWGGWTYDVVEEHFDLGLSPSKAPGSRSRTLKGLLDEVGVWQRALSDSEVQSLYVGPSTARGSIVVGSLNFGTVPADDLINSAGGHVGSVIVRNLSGEAVEIIGAELSDSATFNVPNQWPRRMNDGDSTEIAVRFLPQEKRTYSASLTIRASNSYQGSSVLSGTGRELRADERVTQVLLCPSRDYVAAGDTLSVALFVGIERPLASVGTPGRYHTTIQWDNRVLEPLSTPGLKFDTTGTFGFGQLINTVRKQNQTQLYTFRFRAKQAEIDTTTIIFTGPQGFIWQDDRKAYPALVDSVIRIRVCQDGGAQLIGRSIIGGIRSVTPNPARDVVNVMYTAQEESKLVVTSIEGTDVLSMALESATAPREISFSVKTLPAGSYRISIVSLFGIHSQHIIVLP